MNSEAFQIFTDALNRVKGQLFIGHALLGKPIGGLDAHEPFRAAIVLVVSALDSYIHNLCVEAIFESFLNTRPRNNHFKTIKISLASAEGLKAIRSVEWIKSEIRTEFTRSTFQRSDDVGRALRFVDDRNNKWQRIATRLGYPTEETKNRLDLIVERRNMIAHEADIDPASKSVRAIDPIEADKAVLFIENLVDAIEVECWQPFGGR